jgi:malate dehydrogenase
MSEIHSIAVCSKGEYGIDAGLICSFPIRSNGSTAEVVENIPLNDFSRAKIDASVAELKEERELVKELLV